MIRVLFVCLGNICRSPMAEALFRHRVRLAGLQDKIEADSAGTGDWHVGEPPHAGTARLLAENKIEYDHCARQLTLRDLNDFDYIITMDAMNLEDVRALGRGRARVAPLLSFAPDAGTTEVPDPYYTGNFEEVYGLVSEAADGLLAAIRREHSL